MQEEDCEDDNATAFEELSQIITKKNKKVETATASATDESMPLTELEKILNKEITKPVKARKLGNVINALLGLDIDFSNTDRTVGDHDHYVGKHGTATIAHRSAYSTGLTKTIIKQFASHFKNIDMTK